MKQNLSIDAPLALELMELYLKDLVIAQKSDGIMLGLSGGIDSSVLATIAVRAVGKEHVRVKFLYDRDSEKSSEKNARIMADWLGLEIDVSNFSQIMRERNVYSPLIMKLVNHSAGFNRLIQHLYYLVNRETPFKTSLKVGSGKTKISWLKRIIYNLSIRHFDHGFSERHIYRREVLEQYAEYENLSLIGAANLSEFKVGWFVKSGIDDLPIQPMTGLYKTQVWQLASFLKLPPEIQSQLASPDMMCGITDEFGIGHKYLRLDIILDMIDQNKSDGEITEGGIGKSELTDIRELMEYSEWKRDSIHEAPPVKGMFGGNVRIAGSVDDGSKLFNISPLTNSESERHVNEEKVS